MVSAGGGFVPAQRAQIAQQQAAQAAAAREAALRRRALVDQKQWEVAQEADGQGDLPAASQIYQRLALRRPVSAITRAAQQRLAQIQGEAQGKFKAIEDQLTELQGRPGTPLRFVQLDADKVTALFHDLDELALSYAGVATVDSRIDERVKQLRSQSQFAAILQEPPAAELWKIAQQFEEKQQVCCAVQVYEQATTLLPAPSAKLAKARLTELQKDKAVVIAAERCRTLQQCHEKFRQADELKKRHPDEARKFFAEILERAPADTSVHAAAREQIAMLK